jgi:hypothetical protein
MAWGDLSCVEMGEQGRGRKLLVIPSFYDIEEGLNRHLTIGFSRAGNPKIIEGTDDKLFFLISTEGGYTRRGSGWVSCMPKDGIDDSEFSNYALPRDCFSVLAEGNGADGAAGRIGSWEVYVLEAIRTKIFLRIKYSGDSKSQLLYITKTRKIIDVGINEEGSYDNFSSLYALKIPYFDYKEEEFKNLWKYSGLNRNDT